MSPDLSTAAFVERTKLTAALLNTLAAASVSVGIFGPMVAYLFDFAPQIGRLSPGILGLTLLAWFLLATALHLGGRWLLRRLP